MEGYLQARQRKVKRQRHIHVCIAQYVLSLMSSTSLDITIEKEFIDPHN